MMAATNVVRFPLQPTTDASSHAGVHRHVGHEFVADPVHPSHFVQFYEEDEALFGMVGNFLAPGLRAADRLIVIATQAHREGFLRQLEAVGGEQATRSGQLTLLDARDTLAKFMVDGMPDRESFRSLLSGLISTVRQGCPDARLRAYGEMVDLLWRDGNPDAAIRLEELWNDASKEHAFSLFCAYTVGNFYKEREPSRFFDVCRIHTHVIPTESFSRARALEREIARRGDLEEELRGALRRRAEAEEQIREALRREQEAREEAEAGIQFRELFVGMLGHDLRNPLNTTLNTARILLLRNEVLPEARGRVERIIASGERMQRMIEQLLDLTRVRLGAGIVVDRKFQDADALVAKIVGETRAAHEDREIAYRRQGDCWARLDGDRFEQVVSNLIDNAVAYGDKDRPVSVLLSGSALAVQLSVQNFGSLIEPKSLGHLFDPFARGTQAKGRSDGLGLGLFIADGIVKAHGGVIAVSSSIEKGTTFEVTVPKDESLRF